MCVCPFPGGIGGYPNGYPATDQLGGSTSNTGSFGNGQSRYGVDQSGSSSSNSNPNNRFGYNTQSGDRIRSGSQSRDRAGGYNQPGSSTNIDGTFGGGGGSRYRVTQTGPNPSSGGSSSYRYVDQSNQGSQSSGQSNQNSQISSRTGNVYTTYDRSRQSSGNSESSSDSRSTSQSNRGSQSNQGFQDSDSSSRGTVYSGRQSYNQNNPSFPNGGSSFDIQSRGNRQIGGQPQGNSQSGARGTVYTHSDRLPSTSTGQNTGGAAIAQPHGSSFNNQQRTDQSSNSRGSWYPGQSGGFSDRNSGSSVYRTGSQGTAEINAFPTNLCVESCLALLVI